MAKHSNGLVHEAEFRYFGELFSVRFMDEEDEPVGLLIYTWDNELILHPIASLKATALAAAKEFLEEL